MPNKTFIEVPNKEGCSCNKCPYMRLNTIEKVIDCLKVISNGHDVLGMAPTGSGKTAVAIIGILSAFSQNKRVIYTSPIKALSNEKYNSFYKSLHGRGTL